MLFKKLSTVERVYNIGLEQNSLSHIFDNINVFVKEAEEDLIKLYDLRILEKIPVKNIMTKHIITINKDDDISKLREYIEHYRHMGYPVVDENGKLIGIVSVHDIVGKDDNEKVENVMTKREDMVVTTPDANIMDVGRIMFRTGFSKLPVVDEENNLVGIISNMDVIRSQIEKTTPKKLENIITIDPLDNFEMKNSIADLLKRRTDA